MPRNHPPILAFHGTSAKFAEFNPAFLGTANGTAPSNMAGFHFTSDAAIAATFGPTVIPVLLSLETPITIDAKGRDYSEFKHVLNDRLDRIDKSRHDGLIINNYVDGGTFGEPAPSTHYIVFDPAKIRPAPKTASRHPGHKKSATPP
jgi:hypothetical protein